MRPGRTAVALTLFATILGYSPVSASDPRVSFNELVSRVKELLPLLSGVTGSVPQAVQAADPTGPKVDISRLDAPARLERELRAAIREPATATRLTVPGGSARLGRFTLGSAETHVGHIVVLKGNADVHGRLEGNLVTLDGDVTLHPGAIVTGDILAIGGRVRQLGGQILGAFTELEASSLVTAAALPPVPVVVAQRGAGLIGVFLTFLILGVALVTFGRPNLEIVSDTVSHSFGRSFLAGLLGQILILPTFGMLVVGLFLTVAGALLVPFAVAVYALLAVIAVLGGLLAVAHAMGETITRRRMARGLAVSPNSYRYLITGLTGVAVIWLTWVAFGWVPLAGGVIFITATLATWFIATVGFGAALLSRGGIREEFSGRLLPPAMLTDEYLWATPQMGVPAVKRPPTPPT